MMEILQSTAHTTRFFTGN